MSWEICSTERSLGVKCKDLALEIAGLGVGKEGAVEIYQVDFSLSALEMCRCELDLY